MKIIIFLLILLVLTVKISIAQNISIENNEISVEICKNEFHKDSLLIIIINISDKTMLVSMLDEVLIEDNYIGVGLYSSVFPFLPNLLKKYSGEIELTVIESNKCMLLKKKSNKSKLEKLNFNIDYVLIKTNVFLNSKKKIHRTIYDQEIRMLKFVIN